MVSLHLEDALSASRRELAPAIEEAETELAELRKKAERLEKLISEARLALGDRRADANSRTLHDALATVLVERGPMRAPALRDAVNEMHLYRRGDGGPIDIGQIHARVSRYSEVFRRLPDGRIALVDSTSGSASATGQPQSPS